MATLPAMEKLAKKNATKVIDLLNERLAFERSGVQLYDTLLSRLRTATEDPALKALLGQMKEYREEEKEHEEWLEQQIRSLGGDAHAPTIKSELVTRESSGIEDVIMHDPELPHLFHALLGAELVDNAGWELLAQIADEAGDRGMKREFKKRLHQEEEHLLFIRKAVQKFAFRDVLGEEVKMPRSAGQAVIS